MKKLSLTLLTAVLVASSYIGVATSQSSSSSAPGLMPRGSSAALPGMYFAGDRNTGFYSTSADWMAAAVGGAEAWRYQSTTFFVTGDAQVTGELLAGNGALGAPAYAFLNSTATGVFYDTAGSISNLVLASNGVEVGRFTPNTSTIDSPGASGAIKLRTNGAERAEFQSDGDFAVDTNTLFVDAVNNRVGVNNSSPSSALDVASTFRVSGARTVITDASTGTVRIFGEAAGWADGYLFNGSGGTDRGGFWALGSGDSITNWSIGPTYSAGFFTVMPDGTVLVGSTTDQPEALHVTGDFEFTGTAQRNGITLNNPRTFTATYDPASLAADTSRCDDVTATGITTTGGAVTANIGAVDPAAGCVVATVRASASNTVRVCWRNANAGAACDTASSTWSFTQAQ